MGWGNRTTKHQNPEISIIVPVRDEEENIAPLAEEITGVMEETPWSWECIWVNDGSEDGTESELVKIGARDGRHRSFTHLRNYGQSAALYTGFRESRGEVLITMDGDGQNDPHDIPVLVSRLITGGLDMVTGWRKKRSDNAVRKISSIIANGFRNLLTGDRVRDVGCSMRAFRHPCVENVALFNGMHRFLPTLVRMSGFSRIVEVPVNHRPRKSGKTKYGIHNRLWVGIGDTLAIRWMKYRTVLPEIRSSHPK